MTGGELSEGERVFIQRMAPHVAAGLSIEEAAAAVIKDDERLWCALHDRDTGPEIRASLTREVYSRIRQGEAS